MKIQLTPQEAAKIKSPVNGRGGFQTLLRRLQKQISPNNVLTASPQDVAKLLRYSFEYGQGGFQERTKSAI